MLKLNCWEFIKCGREPGGCHAGDLSVCPATQFKALDGTHGGINAGRACWIVAGIPCQANMPGIQDLKCLDCHDCEFHLFVREEESWHFENTGELLLRLKEAAEQT